MRDADAEPLEFGRPDFKSASGFSVVSLKNVHCACEIFITGFKQMLVACVNVSSEMVHTEGTFLYSRERHCSSAVQYTPVSKGLSCHFGSRPEP